MLGQNEDHTAFSVILFVWIQSVAVVSVLVLRAASQERLAEYEHFQLRHNVPLCCMQQMMASDRGRDFLENCICLLLSNSTSLCVIYQTVTAVCMSNF